MKRKYSLDIIVALIVIILSTISGITFLLTRYPVETVYSWTGLFGSEVSTIDLITYFVIVAPSVIATSYIIMIDNKYKESNHE